MITGLGARIELGGLQIDPKKAPVWHTAGDHGAKLAMRQKVSARMEVKSAVINARES